MVFFSTRLQAHELVLHLAPDQRVERREGFVQEPQLGSTASDRAMPTRCCWPPDSWRG
jgi:hypothetical protein